MLYIVRHGQTDWNLFRRANGLTDTFLNHNGLAQAELQAENLKDVSFDACYCSPLTRTRQTCEIIYSGPVTYDDRLIEINCGEFEGADETDAETMKLAWQALMKGERGTEGWQTFMQRNCDFCDMITIKDKGKNVLVVTHAVNVRVLHYYFSGKPSDYDFLKTTVIKNGGLLTFEN